MSGEADRGGGMSGSTDVGPSGSGTSTPSKSGSSLSAKLAAHLSKPVAPSVSPALSTTDPSSVQASPHGIRLPGHVHHHNGKAPATFADSDAINDSELWKSNAARRAEKAWAIQSEKTLQSDPKFKKFTAAIEKCLATFESVSEWADFIAFLGRLLKTLQASPQFNSIPKKLIVAKRLSQCLNPALPSGVHQRALEVYEHILSCIGPEGLRRDLSVWSPGLLPFFQFASTNVKPIVLNIIELHYLPLRQDLRPIAKSLQLALLPGLEEETSEHFERVLKLLDKIKDSIGQSYFMQNLWLILVIMPVVRLPTLHYLARRIPDLNGDAKDGSEQGVAIASIVGPDLGLTIRAFCAALDDSNLLVLRAMLDILVVKFRLNSTTFNTVTRVEDRVRLLQSALGVVLRRDISLNRRLYAWLLGPSEDAKVQQSYFGEHALQWARLALLSEFNIDVQEREQEPHQHTQLSTLDRQRPYRIFISLLDKWSVGLPMTSALIIDTFRALKRQLDPEESSTPSSEILTSAKMLFEAVDPFAMYRQLFKAICEELQRDEGHDSDSSDIIPLLRFVFDSFRVHDEESRVVHLPTMFAAIVELVLHRPHDRRAPAVLLLARDLLAMIPKRVFSDRSKHNVVPTKSFVDQGAYLYENASSGVDEAAKRYLGFQSPDTVARLLDICSTIPLRNASATVESLTIFCQLLNLLDATMDANPEQERVPWRSAVWMKQMHDVLERAETFTELEACVETFVAGSQCRALLEPVSLQRAHITTSISEKLLRFMQTDTGPYHVRSVELLWTVIDLSPSTPVGTILCRRMVSGSQQERRESFEVFGVLWKYSDDLRLANPLLLDPLLCILDGLQSSNWIESQMSEVWVRNHARNFTAMLDPLLVIIHDKSCHRVPWKRTVEGHEVDFLAYSRPLDHERVRYALSILLQLSHIGGTAMARTIRTTSIKRSTQPELVAFSSKKGVDVEDTYANVIFAILIELLKSDPSEGSAYSSTHEAVHAAVVDVSKVLIVKVQSSAEQLAELESVLLQRILVDVFNGTLQVQGKCLQTLHSIMSARNPSSSARTSAPPPALLLPLIKAGLSTPSNRPVLQQWTDFILGIAPIYRHALSALLLPLNQGLCALIRAGITEIEEAYDSVEGVATCETSDSDVILLLAMSEKVLLQSLETQTLSGDIDVDAQGAAEKGETFSFMGALTNVFSAEPANADGNGASASNAIWKSLHQTVMTLHLAWLSTTMTSAQEDARQDTLEGVRQNIQGRCRRYLERLYRNHSGEVVEALVACWNLSLQQDSQPGCEAAFAVLSILAPSAQIVVTFLCDVISTRTSEAPGGGEKSASATATAGSANATSSSKHMASPGVPDTILLAFLEAYLKRLDAATTAQVWPVVAIFVKEILNHSTVHKAQIFPTLRCLTDMAEKVMDEKNTLEDKKLKRELTDNYVRICDLCILIAGRSFEQTTWIGRRTVTVDADADEGQRDEKMAASIPDLSASTPTLGNTVGIVDAIQQYLASKVLPSLKSFAVDADKITGLVTNIIYYVVSPAIRAKRKSAAVNVNVVNLLLAITALPGTMKSWRTAVSEFFTDNRFFEMDAEAGAQWMPIIFALMTNDKERFVETIGRISTPSTNIFTNREAETKMRVMNIRRLSYVLFSGPKDHWLTQLPLIQEKLVDLLRNSTADPAVSEVYLCLRVLLIRFESRHLSGFWPVVITEMMRLFESSLEELPADNSDALILLDSACRFLDLLVTLQTDEFQIHQWLFITDTVDILYPPDDWEPESILDRISTAIGERRSASDAKASSPATNNRGLKVQRAQSRGTRRLESLRHEASAAAAETSGRNSKRTEDANEDKDLLYVSLSKRRPLLLDSRARSVSAIEDLQPFFANISLHAFESTYASGARVDWLAIEAQTRAAFFLAPDEDD